jgi:RNA polymerase sigma factor (sigma-70 family)
MTILDELLTARVITQREHQILELRYANNMTLYQIAQALDISRGTVTNTLRRAHQKIEIHQREAA